MRQTITAIVRCLRTVQARAGGRAPPAAMVDDLHGERLRVALRIPGLRVFGQRLADCAVARAVDKDLDVVELWSGVGSIVRAADRRGLRTAAFDINRVPGRTDADDPAHTEDMCTEAGFLRAVSLVQRLVPSGLLWMAPVCSSFTFVNSANCQRCEGNRFRGNTLYEPVRKGNLMADACAFLFALSWCRGVEVCVENPSQSAIFKYPTLQRVTDAINRTSPVFIGLAARCAFDCKPVGERYLKKYKLLCTGTWVEATCLPCRCEGRLHKPLVSVRASASGRTQVNGRAAELKESAAYPATFGESIVDAWLAGGAGLRLPDLPPPEGLTDDQVQERPPKRPARRTWLQDSGARGAAASSWQMPSE